MERSYHKWFSESLNRNMELLVFGFGGAPVIFFPTRSAHFYDSENWRIIEAMGEKICDGKIQVFCVDSVDRESFYSDTRPAQRIARHIQYEQYIISEVVPFIRERNDSEKMVAAGCSLGGYHAVNIALKHPDIFEKTVGMSARYDLTQALPHFPDLFDGYVDENIYFNMPTYFVPGIADDQILRQLREMDITLVVGREDSFLQSNQILSELLNKIGVTHQLHIWEEEAHRPRYWREMVKLYL